MSVLKFLPIKEAFTLRYIKLAQVVGDAIFETSIVYADLSSVTRQVEVKQVPAFQERPCARPLTEAIDAFVCDRTMGQSATGFDECAKLREARIFRESLLISGVDLLHNPRDL